MRIDWLAETLSVPCAARRCTGTLLGLIRDSYAISGGVYGAPRVFGDLREAGETCGKHRVARIMRSHKIKAVRGYKVPRTIAGRPSIIAPNRLNRPQWPPRPAWPAMAGTCSRPVLHMRPEHT
jgi:hypothetical protein